MIYKTDKAALAACIKWKRLLGLADWDVCISIQRQSLMECSSVNGECHYETSNKKAEIRLLDPLDYESFGDWEQDHELTLVHELIHLHTVWWNTKGKDIETRLEEQMICLLSKAFIELSRSQGEHGESK